MDNKRPVILRLGTRGSLLASMQSQGVANVLQQLWPDLQVELKIIKTTGDRITDRPLHDLGGKGLFTKELELALLNGEIDFAVHSYKDVPVTMPLVDLSGLSITAVPKRGAVHDVLVAGQGVATIHELPRNARVGTGSLRRRCQLLECRSDLRIVPIRGNIDTRLKMQQTGELDAVILAAAGLERAGLFNPQCMCQLPAETIVPAAAQGALALQCRIGDQSTRRFLLAMNEPVTEQCTGVEREAIRLLNADCHSPIGVYAQMLDKTQITVSFAIGAKTLDRADRFTVSAPAASIRTEMQSILREKKLCD